MKEFLCSTCLKYKHLDLCAYRRKSPRGERKVCKNCSERIKAAAEKRLNV